MPVIGEIATFAFDDTNRKMVDLLRQQGWVACEGQSVARTTGPNGLPNLFQVIGTAWGTDDVNAFNIPDLRGQFLRCWTHGKKVDPDADSRPPLMEGGVGGNRVGSSQAHEFADHDHFTKGGSGFIMAATQEDIAVVHPASRQMRGHGNPPRQGGHETRPANVYVMRCIFTGHAPLPKDVKFFAG